jgi:hypothetical protein
MNFENALEKAYDKDVEKHGQKFADNNTLTLDEVKVAAKIWNAIAIALAEKGLDDFVIISNGSIVSIHFKKEKEENEPDNNKTDKIKGKGKSPKSATASEDAVNGEEEQTENTESAESAQ